VIQVTFLIKNLPYDSCYFINRRGVAMDRMSVAMDRRGVMDRRVAMGRRIAMGSKRGIVMAGMGMSVTIDDANTKNSYSYQRTGISSADAQSLSPEELFFLNDTSLDYIELWNSLAP